MPVSSISVSQINREIRHALLNKLYLDFDIVNCNCILLLIYCKKNNIQQCKCLEDYCENRDKYLNMVIDFYKCDRDKAKNLFILILFGGVYDDWFDSIIINKGKYIEEILNFFDELRCITLFVKDKNMDFFKIIEKKCLNKNKKFNINGSFLAYFLHDMERKCLEIMVEEYISNNNYDKIVLCHDGFLLSKSLIINNEDFNVDNLSEKFSKILSNYLNYPIKVINKPMNEIPEWLDNFLNNESYNEYIDEYDILKKKFEMNNNHFYMVNTKKYYIKNIDENSSIIYIPHSKTEFQNATSKWRVKNYNLDFKKNESSFFEIWNKDSKKLEFNNFIFNCDPNYISNSKYINLWNSFDIEKIEPENDDEKIKEAFELLEKYFENISNGDKNFLDYIKKYISHIIQFPHILNYKIPLLQSPEHGSGKSTFGNLVGSILGDPDLNKYVRQKNGFSGLTEKFADNNLQNVFLYIAEELDSNEGHTLNNKIKSIATRKNITIEKKGETSYEILNKIRIIINTNNLNPIIVSDSERRYIPQRIGANLDINFFEKFYEKVINSSNICRVIYDYFKNIDLSDFNFKNSPETKYMTDLKYANRNLFDKYIDENKEFLIMNSEFIYNKDLIKYFNEWCILNGFKYTTTSIKLGLYIKNNSILNKIFINHKKNDGNGYKINIELLNEYFK